MVSEVRISGRDSCCYSNTSSQRQKCSWPPGTVRNYSEMLRNAHINLLSVYVLDRCHFVLSILTGWEIILHDGPNVGGLNIGYGDTCTLKSLYYPIFYYLSFSCIFGLVVQVSF